MPSPLQLRRAVLPAGAMILAAPEAPEAPAVPTEFTLAFFSTSSLTLNWEALPEGVLAELQWIESGGDWESPLGSASNVAVSYLEITSLSVYTSYDVRIRASKDGLFSDWVVLSNLFTEGIGPAYVTGALAKGGPLYGSNNTAYIGFETTLNSVLHGDASVGVWTGEPTPTYSFDWRVDDVTVGTGITSPTWLAEDEGKPAKVIITGTNPAGDNSTEIDLGNVQTYV